MNTQEFVVTLIGGSLIGAVLSWFTAARQLRLARRMQTVEAFTKLATMAHGYDASSRTALIGIGEQISAIYLIADLANRDKWLRKAGRAFLGELSSWLSKSQDPVNQRLLNAVTQARGLIKRK